MSTHRRGRPRRRARTHQTALIYTALLSTLTGMVLGMALTTVLFVTIERWLW